jgi:hypothetical protein
MIIKEGQTAVRADGLDPSLRFLTRNIYSQTLTVRRCSITIELWSTTGFLAIETPRRSNIDATSRGDVPILNGHLSFLHALLTIGGWFQNR